MSNRAKFWRLFVTSVLAYPLNFIIACFHFLLLLAFLPESLLQLIAHPEGSRNDFESVPLEICLLIFYSAVAPLSLAFTLAAPTKSSRAIYYFIGLNLTVLGVLFFPRNSAGAVWMLIVENVAGSYADRLHGYVTATHQSLLRAQLIILIWALFSLRFIINRRHPLPSPIASSQDSTLPSHIT